MDRLRIPGGVAAGCVLVLIMVVSANAKQWEGRKSVEVTEVLATQMDKQKIEYLKKFAEIKREQENKKEVDGGSFFNILEAIREISGSPDMASFVRRSVLSCVRLFRCRMVMFYSHQTPDGKPATWELMGRYDGKGYVHDVKETLSVDSHERLKEALKVGSTELLKGYPNEATQALLIAVAAERPLGALILYNKVGNFDAKDLMAARVFAGFLPNLLAWHVK